MFKLKRYREVIFTSILNYVIILAGWFSFHIYFPDSMSVLIRTIDIGFFGQVMVISIYWLSIFVVMGAYKKLHLISRLNEFLNVLKASILGALIFLISKTHH